jgi:hydrogenase/urease accessory protein HupE
LKVSRPISLTVLTMIVIFPEAAMAHLVTSGLGPFYDGALHLALSPADLLGLVAVTLLAGLSGRKAARWAVIVLPLAWFVGGIVGSVFPAAAELSWMSIIAFLIVGVLVAIDFTLPSMTVASLAGAFGVLSGLQNGSALAAVGAGLSALPGVVVAVLITALLISALVVSMRADWPRIVLRVAGSWIAAVGMLMFGWMLKAAV